MAVDVSIKNSNGEVIGWDTHNKKKVHELIIKRNHLNFSQARHTPFGEGVHQLGITGPNKHNTINQILEGTYTPSCCNKIEDDYFRGLKQAYSDDTKQEARKIGDPVTVDDFKFFFKHKSEKTESSLSGRHVGHYKAIVLHEGFVQMHINMINIGLLCGVALDRWKHVLDIMLEKAWRFTYSLVEDYSII